MNPGSEPAGRASVPSGQPASPQSPAVGNQPAGPPPGQAQPPVPQQPGPYQHLPSPPAGGPPSGGPPHAVPGQPFPPAGAPGSPAGGPARPVAAGPRGSRRPGWQLVAVLIVVAVLTAGVAVQAWQVRSLSAELDRATAELDELAQGQAYGAERLDALEDRATELERVAGDVFDTEAVAAAVLPSVFMVVAGEFSGTAFAMGAGDGDGGTNLFTNYHVVEAVWESGDTEVRLQRQNQTYSAEIVDVEPGNDVAWLRSDNAFTGLASASEEVRAGQPIIAVGAPRGLTDTVTSGVVSTPAQELQDGSGPWIQFDAAINPGNSGGPVINSSQEVVGIATAKGRESEGIGFAVPIDVACGLFDIC